MGPGNSAVGLSLALHAPPSSTGVALTLWAGVERYTCAHSPQVIAYRAQVGEGAREMGRVGAQGACRLGGREGGCGLLSGRRAG
jgi:hypothetical protein